MAPVTRGGILCLPSGHSGLCRAHLDSCVLGPQARSGILEGVTGPGPREEIRLLPPMWRGGSSGVTTWVSSALDAAALACRGCDCQGLRGLRNEGGGQLREGLEGIWEGEDEHGCGSKIYWNNEGYTLRKRPPNHRGAASCGARVTCGGLWTCVA